MLGVAVYAAIVIFGTSIDKLTAAPAPAHQKKRTKTKMQYD